MDTLLPAQRSLMMSRIRGKDTAPEMRVRRLAHALGLRFRLHRIDLPGSPDLVFPSRRVVVFVHGCFWHRHEGCIKAYRPKSNIEFWQSKFDANVTRDKRAMRALADRGWDVSVIWECETTSDESMRCTLGRILKRRPRRR